MVRQIFQFFRSHLIEYKLLAVSVHILSISTNTLDRFILYIIIKSTQSFHWCCLAILADYGAVYNLRPYLS